jgi:preprotein translocase subunit YajC
MQTLNILLQAPSAGGGGASTLIMIGMMVIVFYFFMIRPQMKKAKTEKQFKETVQKGDKIITIGGVHGKILELNDKTFIIEVEGGNRLKIEKTAISMDATKALNAPTVAVK